MKLLFVVHLRESSRPHAVPYLAKSFLAKKPPRWQDKIGLDVEDVEMLRVRYYSF
jgi:hypothetical protein